MSMQSGDSEFLNLLGSPIEESIASNTKHEHSRPIHAGSKGSSCASAVAKSLDALVEDICEQNCRNAEMSIDKNALSMKLRDIVLQRTLLELEKHTNRKTFAAGYTSEEIRQKYMYTRGMLDKTHWKHPKKSPERAISRESLALLNWTISKLPDLSPQKERSNTFVGSSTSSERTVECEKDNSVKDASLESGDSPNMCARPNVDPYTASPKMSLCNPIATFAKIVGNVNLQFVNEFNDVYKRNNKKGGIKSLRCFPLCKEFGH